MANTTYILGQNGCTVSQDGTIGYARHIIKVTSGDIVTITAPFKLSSGIGYFSNDTIQITTIVPGYSVITGQLHLVYVGSKYDLYDPLSSSSYSPSRAFSDSSITLTDGYNGNIVTFTANSVIIFLEYTPAFTTITVT